MHKIHLPPHLGIETPESLPFIELAVTLANKGYTLRNRMDGDLEAVAYDSLEYRPPLYLDNVCPTCGAKKMHCPGHLHDD